MLLRTWFGSSRSTMSRMSGMGEGRWAVSACELWRRIGRRIRSELRFGIEVASSAGLPVIQNLAWNVFTVDLSVCVVVVR